MNLIIEILSEGNIQTGYYCKEKAIPITFKKEEATKFTVFELNEAFQVMMELYMIFGLIKYEFKIKYGE